MVDILHEAAGLSELAKRVAADLADAGREDLAYQYIRQLIREREAMEAVAVRSLGDGGRPAMRNSGLQVLLHTAS